MEKLQQIPRACFLDLYSNNNSNVEGLKRDKWSLFPFLILNRKNKNKIKKGTNWTCRDVVFGTIRGHLLPWIIQISGKKMATPIKLYTSCSLLLAFLFPFSNSVQLDGSKLCLSEKHASLFIFGDSFFNAGNNNYINKTAAFQANFAPYGETFFKYPTSRFFDGRLISDFIGKIDICCCISFFFNSLIVVN